MGRDSLRFVMVTTFYPPYSFGGDGIYVQQLARALARRGHTVEVVHDVDAFTIGGGNPELPPAPEPPRVKVHALRSLVPRLATLATHQLGRPTFHARELRSLLAREFDVVHFHNVSLVGGPGLLSYGTGVKLYTAHEHWLVCANHVLWRHGREPCDARECVRCVLRARRPPQLWRSGDWLTDQWRHVDAFLALSEFSAAKHREFGFAPEMTVLPSFLPDDEPVSEGSDPDSAAPSDQDVPYFLFVGRLEAIKGLDDVIPRFDRRLGAELWIAGKGADETRLRALADGYAVRFLGHLSAHQLRKIYRSARAVIAPSRCFEVFPLVLLEAFREGTPVIARALGPYPELVAESGGGVCFSDTHELDAHLRRFVGDPDHARALGARSRESFRMRWSEAVVIDRYLEFVRDLTARRAQDAQRAAPF